MATGAMVKAFGLSRENTGSSPKSSHLLQGYVGLAIVLKISTKKPKLLSSSGFCDDWLQIPAMNKYGIEDSCQSKNTQLGAPEILFSLLSSFTYTCKYQHLFS